MIQTLERRMTADWQGLRLSGVAPRRLEFFMTSGVTGKHGKVIFLVFREHDPHPIALVKVPRLPSARPWTEHEFAMLKALEEVAPEAAGSMFPRAIFLEKLPARCAAVQSLLPGMPGDRLYASLGPGERSYAELSNRAAAWLKQFWNRMGFLEGVEAALWGPFREAAVTFLEERSPQGEERAALETLLAEIESRRESTMLWTFGHGDLIPSNLLIDGDQVGAVDWEFGSRRQMPWVDPVHFAVSFSLHHAVLARRPRREAFERGFLEDGWIRRENQRFLDTAFDEGGVPRELLQLILPAYCVYFAVQMSRFFSPEYAIAKDWAEIAVLSASPKVRAKIGKI